MVYQDGFYVDTSCRLLIDVSAQVKAIVKAAKVVTGLCNIFIAHTSASLILCENADPTVCDDLELFMTKLVKDGDPNFLHTAEGIDDMSAHIRSILTQSALTLPVSEGRLKLGTWQGIFLWEHRLSPHRRSITVTLLGV